jgi:dihydrofolate synthase/folylpolyglutamate synthase
MTYQEIVTYLYGLGRFGIRPGLAYIKTLLTNLSDTQDALQVIHVSGTNGQRSTASFISSILAAGGCKVGLFTSPHLVSFTERIRINSIEISEKEVVSVAGRVMSAAPAGTTFFEMITAMALLHFAEQGTDAVILETGMGGRLDATNVTPKLLSVITPVALDHCEYLGETITRIACEKAGIILPGKPTVVSSQQQEALEMIEEACAELGPLYSFACIFGYLGRRAQLSWPGVEPEWSEAGNPRRYQAANAATALCAAELLALQGFL